jgi:hypothetical protein
MTPTLWISLVLGAGGGIGGILAVVTRIVEWRRNREKAEGEIQLGKASYDEIAVRAAKINSEERIQTERWWKEQFDAVKEQLIETNKQLQAEKKWRRRTTQRLREHLPWDKEQYDNCPQHGPPPPLLADDEDEEDLVP